MATEEKAIGIEIDKDKGTFVNTVYDEELEVIRLEMLNEEEVETEEDKKYRLSIESGDRRNLMEIDSNFSWSGSLGLKGLIDGTNNSNVYFSSSSSNDGKFIEFTFQHPVKINGFMWTQSSATNQGSWNFQVLSDSGEWTTLHNFDYKEREQEESFDNSTLSKKYRMSFVKGSVSSSPWQYEITFKTEESVTPAYKQKGHWESDIIDLKYKFKEFKKVSLDKDTVGDSIVTIEYRTADTEAELKSKGYTLTEADGSFKEHARKFIQVKLNFYPKFELINNKIVFKNDKDVKNLITKEGKIGYFSAEEELGLHLNKNPFIVGEKTGKITTIKLDKKDFEEIEEINITFE